MGALAGITALFDLCLEPGSIQRKLYGALLLRKNLCVGIVRRNWGTKEFPKQIVSRQLRPLCALCHRCRISLYIKMMATRLMAAELCSRTSDL